MSLLLSAAALLVSASAAQELVTADQLFFPPAMSGTSFGHDVSLDGGYGLIDARGSNIFAPGAGALTLLRQQNTGLDAREVFAGDAVPINGLGDRVRVKGDLIVAGTRLHALGTTLQGRIYLWGLESQTPVLEGVLDPPAAQMGETGFGAAVEIIDRDTVAAGLQQDVSIGTSGTVRIYTRTSVGWGLTQTLSPGQAQPSNTGGLGVALASDGDWLVGSQSLGAVHVWRRDAFGAYQLAQLLDDPLAGSQTNYGYRVAIQGDLLAVTRPMQSSMFVPAVARVYAFRNIAGTWTLEGTLFSSRAYVLLASVYPAIFTNRT